MPRNVNCKYSCSFGKCEKLPKKFFIFKPNCIEYCSTQKCMVADRFSRHPRERQPKQESILPKVSLSTPMPIVKPPKTELQKERKEEIETLKLIEKHLSEIASCVRSAPMHGTGNVIKTANWNV